MKKILIVDDEPNILMTLEYSFKKADFHVFIARDGQEAIDILQNEIPDLVILDIMMPNVDGFETLAFIKSKVELALCKVIFLSAKNRPEDIQKGIDSGADDYLTKPFSNKKLIERVIDLIS
jgi:DNA-binding response OmpR family regulator